MSSRPTGFRKTKPGIVIIGEGLTEQYYFSHLKKLKGFRCTVEPRLQRNTSISSFEKKINELIDSDIQIICVFDTDVTQKDPTEKERVEIFKKKYGEQESVVLCDSLPSIEYWFLLHFKGGQKNLTTSGSVIRSLRRFLKHYEKTQKHLQNDQWVKELNSGSGDMLLALQKAERESKSNRPDHCPYTNIFKGIHLLMKTME